MIMRRHDHASRPQWLLYWKMDNTDWLGILRPGWPHWVLRSVHDLTAIVVGIGGTSMASSYVTRRNLSVRD
ncbi:hypothetical protein PC128_g11996 [Phytophthora cactorum]|nr:hypothetical protein PC120_g8743 [Phytophthora cactorum]KAG3188887.1 hypothetical protein PC128_g11996 [Phytophthora cactorum]